MPKAKSPQDRQGEQGEAGQSPRETLSPTESMARGGAHAWVGWGWGAKCTGRWVGGGCGGEKAVWRKLRAMAMGGKKPVSFSEKVSFVYSPVILGLALASDWSIAPCDTFGAHLGLALFSSSNCLIMQTCTSSPTRDAGLPRFLPPPPIPCTLPPHSHSGFLFTSSHILFTARSSQRGLRFLPCPSLLTH